MSDPIKPICDICNKESRGLRKCNDCNTIFCGPCIHGFMNTEGAMIEVLPHCPKCKSEDINDI